MNCALNGGGGNYKVAPVYVTNKHNQISTSRIFFEVNLDDPSNWVKVVGVVKSWFKKTRANRKKKT